MGIFLAEGPGEFHGGRNHRRQAVRAEEVEVPVFFPKPGSIVASNHRGKLVQIAERHDLDPAKGFVFLLPVDSKKLVDGIEKPTRHHGYFVDEQVLHLLVNRGISSKLGTSWMFSAVSGVLLRASAFEARMGLAEYLQEVPR